MSAMRAWFEAAVTMYYSAEYATSWAVSACSVVVNDGVPRQSDGHDCSAFLIA